MPLKIKDTKLVEAADHGGAVVRLMTDRIDYGLEVRAFTQSDAGAVFGRILNPEVPTNVAAHVTYLEPDRVAAIHDGPSGHAKSIDALLSRCSTLNPDALRLAATTYPNGYLWDPTLDVDWLRAGISSKADVLALPSRPHEPVAETLHRMNNGATFMADLPDDLQRAVAPTLRLDHRKFAEAFRVLVENAVPLVVIEFHGLARVAGNLDAMRSMIRAAARPPYVVATNVMRKEQRACGSGTLIANAFGIQACAPAVFHGTVPDLEDERERKAEQIWWMHRPYGGYQRAVDLPGTFGAACACPDHQSATGHITTGAPLGELLNARRRHETWAHLQERPLLTEAIRHNRFADEYLNVRPYLRKSIEAIVGG